MLTHAGKLRLGVVGGPSSAARPWLCVFTSTPQSHFVRQLPVKGSLLVRFTSLHDDPALKGDSSRARPVGDAARGESGGIGSIASGSVARRPYSNQRCGFCEAKAGGVEKRKKLRLLSSTPPSAYFNSLLMHRWVGVFQLVLFGVFGKVRLIAGVVAALNSIKIFVRIELASVYFRYAYGNV